MMTVKIKLWLKILMKILFVQIIKKLVDIFLF